MRAFRFLATTLLVVLPFGLRAETKPIPPAPSGVTKPVPQSVDDLKAIQKQTKLVLDKVIPCTVGLRVGNATGSGVIVSEDGLILTAGHVSGEPGKEITVVMHDGSTVKGKTLGLNRLIDSGMCRITTPGKYPFCDVGVSKELKLGQWCIAVGQPGGPRPGRTPVVRLGRVGVSSPMLIQTDCTLVGGDSGGPLFDMQARVIGIHSRIAGPITANIHVPADTYRDTWDQLVSGERIGENQVYLGVQAGDDPSKCKLGQITPESPADKAGLKPGDLILKFAGTDIKNYGDMVKELQKKKPGDEVTVFLERDKNKLELKVKLGKRPG